MSVEIIDFIKELDASVFREGRVPGGLHPSEAYHCPLRDYFQMTRVKGLGKTFTAEDMDRMEEGEFVHDLLQKRFLKIAEKHPEYIIMNEIPVKDPIFNISGRLDSVLINTELKKMGFVEIKTTGTVVSSPYESAKNQLATYLGVAHNIPELKEYSKYKKEAWFIYHKRGMRMYFSGDTLLSHWRDTLYPYLVDLLGYIGRREEPAPQKHYVYGKWCTGVCEYRHLCPIAKKGG